MPIADTDGYSKGHSKHVYDSVVSPAFEMAGYTAVRADDVKAGCGRANDAMRGKSRSHPFSTLCEEN